MPGAIRAGLSIQEFWDLTFKEICIYVEAMNEEKLDEARYHATLIHTLGGLIGLAAWSGKPYPAISEVFPELFNPEEIAEQQAEIAAKIERDKWLAYAESLNLKRREGKA